MAKSAFEVVMVRSFEDGSVLGFVAATVREEGPMHYLLPDGRIISHHDLSIHNNFGRFASMPEAQAVIDAYEARRSDQGAA